MKKNDTNWDDAVVISREQAKEASYQGHGAHRAEHARDEELLDRVGQLLTVSELTPWERAGDVTASRLFQVEVEQDAQIVAPELVAYVDNRLSEYNTDRVPSALQIAH